MPTAVILNQGSSRWVCQTPSGTEYTLLIDDEWSEIQIRNSSGRQVGEFEFKFLDPDYKLMRMYCNDAKSGGIGRAVLQFFKATTGADVYASTPDGQVRDDQSHLTEDAPGFVVKMIAEGWIKGYC